MFHNIILVIIHTSITPLKEISMTSDKNETGLTYRDAGVDIDAGEALVEAIKPEAKEQ